jgi:hypothetical protein
VKTTQYLLVSFTWRPYDVDAMEAGDECEGVVDTCVFVRALGGKLPKKFAP